MTTAPEHRDEAPRETLPDPPPAERPGLLALALTFARIGMSSFGGGNSAWIRRELVDRHGWLGNDQFLAGQAICQILPGATTVSLAVFCGAKLRGGPGAVAATLGLVMPSMLLVLGAALLYRRFGQSPAVQHVLAGMSAAAVGLTLQNGASAARRSFKGWVDGAVALGVAVTVGALHWPIWQTLATFAPLAIGLAYNRNRS